MQHIIHYMMSLALGPAACLWIFPEGLAWKPICSTMVVGGQCDDKGRKATLQRSCTGPISPSFKLSEAPHWLHPALLGLPSQAVHPPFGPSSWAQLVFSGDSTVLLSPAENRVSRAFLAPSFVPAGSAGQ